MDPTTASAKLDRIMGVDWSVPADRIAEVLPLARVAAMGGKKRDLMRLAGVLMFAAAHTDDEAAEIHFGAKSVAWLDRLADDGCETSGSIILEIGGLVSGEIISAASRVSRQIAKDI